MRRPNRPLALAAAAIEGLLAAAFVLAPHGPLPVDATYAWAAGQIEMRLSPAVAATRVG